MDRSSDGKEGSAQEEEERRGRPHQPRPTLVVHSGRELLCRGGRGTLKGIIMLGGGDRLGTDCYAEGELLGSVGVYVPKGKIFFVGMKFWVFRMGSVVWG